MGGARFGRSMGGSARACAALVLALAAGCDVASSAPDAAVAEDVRAEADAATDAVATDAATDANDAPEVRTDSGPNDVLVDAPEASAPSTDAPSTDAPSTDAPSTDAPSTDAGFLTDVVDDVRFEPIAAPVTEAIACLAGGWCFENPRPTSITLRALSVASPTRAWTVGDAGAIWRWEGRSWQPTASGVATRVTGVWDSGTTVDAWATSDSGVLRWDGARWNVALPAPTGEYVAVWGSTPSNVWVAGRSVQHWDGERWTAVATPVTGELRALHGTGADNVWAVGAGNLVLRWDGAAWRDRSLTGSAPTTVTGVWSAGAADTYVTTADGFVRRWRGAGWTALYTPSSGGWVVNAIWGTSPVDLWATGLTAYGVPFVTHWDGTRWLDAFVEGDEPLLAIGGSGPNDAWTVGRRSLRVRWDGSRWRNPFAPARGSAAHFVSVHASAPDNAWAVAPHAAWRWDGTSWAMIPIPVDLAGEASSVWTAGPSDTFIACNRGGALLRWDGTSFRRLGAPVTGTAALWGTSPSNVWVVGGMGSVARWDGALIRAVVSPTRSDLGSVWGVSPTEVWAAGADGTVIRWDGLTWRTQTTGATGSLRRLAGTGRDDLWAVGGAQSAGVALRSRSAGTLWEDASGGVRDAFLDVLATAPAEAVVTVARPWGVGSELRRWNGSAWARLPLGTTATLRRLGGSGDDLFAAGDRGALWRRRDGVWSEVPKASRGSLTRVVDAGAAGRWAAGRDVLRWDGAQWRGGGEAIEGFLDLGGLVVFSATDAWALRDSSLGVRRWDGLTWTHQEGTEGMQLRDLWGARTDDLWVVGGFGDSLHWDGARFSRVTGLSSMSFVAVTGTAADDVWAYGNDLAHWNGSAWTSERDLCSAPIGALVARARDDVWAAAPGCLERWDGARWSYVTPGVTFVTVGGMVVNSSRDIWIVGTDQFRASIKHFDGTSWRETIPGLEIVLRSIARDATGRLWAVGDGGTILTHAPE